MGSFKLAGPGAFESRAGEAKRDWLPLETNIECIEGVRKMSVRCP